ncbi:uncharacterized protein LOC142665060 [Rhinoderma darwinii]|uniref:uncharacterized protein LOC142665060 n=1 Tax=Rhinoderma darwinii TaxID=43563 RepID=UPI003F669D32
MAIDIAARATALPSPLQWADKITYLSVVISPDIGTLYLIILFLWPSTGCSGHVDCRVIQGGGARCQERRVTKDASPRTRHQGNGREVLATILFLYGSLPHLTSVSSRATSRGICHVLCLLPRPEEPATSCVICHVQRSLPRLEESVMSCVICHVQRNLPRLEESATSCVICHVQRNLPRLEESATSCVICHVRRNPPCLAQLAAPVSSATFGAICCTHLICARAAATIWTIQHRPIFQAASCP